MDKSTLVSSSTKDIEIESTFLLKYDYGQGHIPDERYCKSENYKSQPDLSRHTYHKVRDTTAGMSVQKNEAYGLVNTLTLSPSITD